jgi:hypothetical protein
MRESSLENTRQHYFQESAYERPWAEHDPSRLWARVTSLWQAMEQELAGAAHAVPTCQERL